MSLIICPRKKCGFEVKARIGLVVKAVPYYSITFDRIGTLWMSGRWDGFEKHWRAGRIVGFYCSRCHGHFPKKWKKEIRDYLRLRRIKEKLKATAN